MEHGLIDTLVASVVLAFAFGLVAKRLRLPTILAYLLAGVALGPHTPGFVADVDLARQLAELGVMLLMFGVGMHFSVRDLLNVRRVALPGAIAQMGFATLIGAGLVLALGYGWPAALLFGLSLSVASTVVLLRALEQRKLVESEAGKIAIGWLIVEDIAMVLAIVLLPVLTLVATGDTAPSLGEVALLLGSVTAKIGIFAAGMIVIGRRLLPPVLSYVANTRSHEMSTLATLAIALGCAYLAQAVFGASFALGAFLAGLVLNESKIGHKFAEQSLSMRDTFSVLFFVSVGMLFDPMVLLEQPALVVATLGIIIIGKSAAAMGIMRLFRQPLAHSLIISASLAQIGEFSFILAGMGVAAGLLQPALFNLVVAGALLSIALNHFLFLLLDRRLGLHAHAMRG